MKKRRFIDRFIGAVERVGNKLPHPFWIFTFLVLIILVLSMVMSANDVSVTYLAASRDPSMPPEMKTVAVKNLLTVDAVNGYLGNFAGIYGSFYPIGIVLIMMMAIGLAERSGFLTALMRKLILGAPVQWIIIIIAFVGINSNLASDAGVVFTPLVAAAMFKSLGINPWIGIIAGYAAANGGYTANFVIAGTDALLAGITESITVGNNIDYTCSPVMNWYFLIAGTVVLSVGTAIATKYFLVPYLKGSESTDVDASELAKHELTGEEIRGLKVAAIAALAYIGLIVALAVPETSFLRNPQGGFVPKSPLLNNVVAMLFLFFCTIGVSYGYAAKTIKSINDIPGMMQESLKGILSFLVVALPAAFFIQIFNESQMPTVLAVKGAELLKSADITGIPLFILFIFICTVVNLFITSGVAKWLILGPVFVPMLAMVNISPAMTQLIYRIGDTCTNIISPIDYYVPVILGMLEAYKTDDRPVGIGTLISLSLPFSIVYMIGFVLLLIVWYVFNLPLGPGASIYM